MLIRSLAVTGGMAALGLTVGFAIGFSTCYGKNCSGITEVSVIIIPVLLSMFVAGKICYSYASSNGFNMVWRIVSVVLPIAILASVPLAFQFYAYG